MKKTITRKRITVKQTPPPTPVHKIVLDSVYMSQEIEILFHNERVTKEKVIHIAGQLLQVDGVIRATVFNHGWNIWQNVKDGN